MASLAAMTGPEAVHVSSFALLASVSRVAVLFGRFFIRSLRILRSKRDDHSAARRLIISLARVGLVC